MLHKPGQCKNSLARLQTHGHRPRGHRHRHAQTRTSSTRTSTQAPSTSPRTSTPPVSCHWQRPRCPSPSPANSPTPERPGEQPECSTKVPPLAPLTQTQPVLVALLRCRCRCTGGKQGWLRTRCRGILGVARLEGRRGQRGRGSVRRARDAWTTGNLKEARDAPVRLVRKGLRRRAQRRVGGESTLIKVRANSVGELAWASTDRHHRW